MIDVFTQMGWVQSIAFAACFISVIAAVGAVVEAELGRRHERAMESLELDFKREESYLSDGGEKEERVR